MERLGRHADLPGHVRQVEMEAFPDHLLLAEPEQDEHRRRRPRPVRRVATESVGRREGDLAPRAQGLAVGGLTFQDDVVVRREAEEGLQPLAQASAPSERAPIGGDNSTPSG
jgi:hypothetical protein